MINKRSYDLSGKDSSFHKARQALVDWQINGTDSEEHKMLRENYKREYNKRQEKYKNKYDKIAVKANVAFELIKLVPQFEALGLLDERKKIRAIINLLYGYNRG